MTTYAVSPVHTTPASPARTAATPIPLTRLIRVEGRKMIDTRAGRGLLIAIGVVTVGVIVLLLLTADAESLTFANLAFISATPQALLLPVIGILAVTGEWTCRTSVVTFTLEPRRLRVVAAKLAAGVVLSLVFVVIALAAGALANVIGMLFLDGNGSWAMGGARLGGATLVQVIGVLEGMAFGLAIMNSVGAIVALLALPLVFSIVGGLIAGFASVAPWLDLSSATWVLVSGDPSATDWLRLATAAALWIGVPLAVGLIRTRRREVK